MKIEQSELSDKMWKWFRNNSQDRNELKMKIKAKQIRTVTHKIKAAQKLKSEDLRDVKRKTEKCQKHL